ncbi:MAG: DegQ family serine endoprotease [Proteobacteria bacterium]|nr:DegQ family serine endoprotease [Pseudomonadota bacterium]
MTIPRWVFGCLVLAISQLSVAALPDFTSIVEKNSPAVVKILVDYPQANRRSSDESLDYDALPDYLKRFFDPDGMPPSRRQQSSMGSGFVLSDDGYIVTNNHVVENAEKVRVRFTDRREFDAEVIGLDTLSDLALLKIDAKNLPTLTLGQPADLAVGEWVLAIGSPFGLDFSVTAGIVSAMGRSLPTETNENYVPFIQTDVAINPGNSGGPLFNLKGEVVGVNSQIYTRSGGSIGLSFAIPVSVVRDVVEQLRDSGAVQRGWLGVSIQNIDKTLAEGFGLERPAGALVSSVMKDSPADAAGIREGDVILEFDGEFIETSTQLPHVVGLIKPGSEVKVRLMREGSERTIKVKVGALAARDGADVASSASIDANKLGLVVAEATPEELEQLGLAGAVVVRQVESDSPAAEQEVMTGDVVTMVGSRPIRSVSDFNAAIAELAAGQSVPVRLLRRGAPLFIGLKVPTE